MPRRSRSEAASPFFFAGSLINFLPGLEQSAPTRPLSQSLRAMSGRWLIASWIALLAMWIAACGPRELTPAQRGEVVYRTNCASCHNRDPNLPGWLGPPIAGSSRTLIADRVLHVAYPPGYVPKRTTHQMRALPWLNGHIDDLTAYLDAAADDHK
jgi:mono/diheme cytochrome c family protein